MLAVSHRRVRQRSGGWRGERSGRPLEMSLAPPPGSPPCFGAGRARRHRRASWASDLLWTRVSLKRCGGRRWQQGERHRRGLDPPHCRVPAPGTPMRRWILPSIWAFGRKSSLLLVPTRSLTHSPGARRSRETIRRLRGAKALDRTGIRHRWVQVLPIGWEPLPNLHLAVPVPRVIQPGRFRRGASGYSKGIARTM